LLRGILQEYPTSTAVVGAGPAQSIYFEEGNLVAQKQTVIDGDPPDARAQALLT
jgi:hypothetical protein